MFYNWYGCSHGFAGRKSRVVRNVKGEIVQQTFLCHREGNRSERNRNPDVQKRELKPISRCGCEAKIQVHIDFDSGRWYIKFFDDVHNHSFLADKYEWMLPAHMKMTKYEKYQMNTMRKYGIPTSWIYGYFATQAGGFENVGYTRRDMYNEQLKGTGSNSSNADCAIEFLKAMCARDDMMYWRHTVNQDGTLRHLFWCDGISRMDYSVFGDILAFQTK
ncbi:protein FAR1-RELATED SEQUENCE 5 [Medicago truncatula]|nr:protein FAR1-RELATED SEQUENCE 5 [Medicago truncatula]